MSVVFICPCPEPEQSECPCHYIRRGQRRALVIRSQLIWEPGARIQKWSGRLGQEGLDCYVRLAECECGWRYQLIFQIWWIIFYYYYI